MTKRMLQCQSMAKPINYISVESVEEYSKKVEALGGKIVVTKMEIPGLGWWALALDPEGNHFGMLEYMQKTLIFPFSYFILYFPLLVCYQSVIC